MPEKTKKNSYLTAKIVKNLTEITMGNPYLTEKRIGNQYMTEKRIENRYH